MTPSACRSSEYGDRTGSGAPVRVWCEFSSKLCMVRRRLERRSSKYGRLAVSAQTSVLTRMDARTRSYGRRRGRYATKHRGLA